jgi:serine/threonine protein phosphatase PrpC
VAVTSLEPGSPHLVLQHARPEPLLFQLAGGQAAVYSNPGYEEPGANEDTALLLSTGPDSAVLAVADGVGGAPAGHLASAIAVRCLAKAVVAAIADNLDTRLAILDGFERANEKVLADRTGGSTTLAVAELRGRSVRTYHVGDSFVMVTGQRGRIKALTVAHSPVGYGVVAGLLDEQEAMHHEDRHLISNTVGSPDMRIEIGAAFDLAPRDTLLLASDGLSDNLHVEEIIGIIRKGSLEHAARSLAEQALRRMRGCGEDQPSKPDDLTFALFRL